MASTCLILIGSGPARAADPLWLIPPVDGPIESGFEAPADAYSSGHRGIDFKVSSGSRVRAAAPGRVTFAGEVAGALFVTVSHGSGIETTYSRLRELFVGAGQEVSEGAWLGTSGESHAGRIGLHFAVKVDGGYIDPVAMLGPTDVTGAIHLAPLVWEPSTEVPEPLRSVLSPTSAGSVQRGCEPPMPRVRGPVVPDQNIAVAVAGIGSQTKGGVSADMYEHGPELLGYPARRVYEFSYAGTSGLHLHRPYPRKATFGDIETAAARLRRLLREIARRHPGRDVDLIAHSQGGIVARTYLTKAARAFSPGLPRVAHLVTFSSPHQGAPAAGEVDELSSRTLTGAPILAGASYLARHDVIPMPDPYSTAVSQLAPGSDLMRSLAREDVMFGTRVLALAIANDVIVPADHSGLPGELGRVVAPSGINGHSAIVAGPEARGIAYDFLRGAADRCAGAWDTWGSRVGAGISWLESRLAEGYGALEGLILRR